MYLVLNPFSCKYLMSLASVDGLQLTYIIALSVNFTAISRDSCSQPFRGGSNTVISNFFPLSIRFWKICFASPFKIVKFCALLILTFSIASFDEDGASSTQVISDAISFSHNPKLETPEYASRILGVL